MLFSQRPANTAAKIEWSIAQTRGLQADPRDITMMSFNNGAIKPYYNPQDTCAFSMEKLGYNGEKVGMIKSSTNPANFQAYNQSGLRNYLAYQKAQGISPIKDPLNQTDFIGEQIVEVNPLPDVWIPFAENESTHHEYFMAHAHNFRHRRVMIAAVHYTVGYVSEANETENDVREYLTQHLYPNALEMVYPVNRDGHLNIVAPQYVEPQVILTELGRPLFIFMNDRSIAISEYVPFFEQLLVAHFWPLNTQTACYGQQDGIHIRVSFPGAGISDVCFCFRLILYADGSCKEWTVECEY